ncbi:MAG: hypothetical protein ACYSW3_20825 [Planctomycetota bacterium]|jgi:hypothetical protein
MLKGVYMGNLVRDDEMMKTIAAVFLLSFLLSSCTSTQEPLLERIEIDAHVLKFIPTRDDFTVGRAVFTFHCAREATYSEYENNVYGNRKVEKCCGYKVNDDEPENQLKYVYLKQVAKNQFELAPLEVEFSKERSGHLCMSVKVWFNEVTNMSDSMYYENLDDRYSLVSFCTSYEDFDWINTKPRFGQNRVSTLEQFKEALSKPFVIKLNQQPLPHP